MAFEKQFRAWPLLAPLFATPVETSVFVRSVLPDATQRARGKEKFDPAYQPRVRQDAPDEDDGFNQRRVSSRTQLDSTIELVIAKEQRDPAISLVRDQIAAVALLLRNDTPDK